jgi:threonine dehydrogenase-like Zn-dependent dehydrogenase
MPCKRCPACIEGNDNLCEKGEVIGCTINGGFSEDMFIPEQMVLSGGVVKVPNQIDPLSGTLTEILACCYHGINLVNFKAGERALIIGDGPIGLTFVQLTKLMGASYVVTTGHRQIRKELSKKLGADEALDAMDISNLKSAKEFFNLVVVATSNTDVISDAIDLTKSGGHILLFSGYSYGTKIEIDPNKLHYREIQLHGSIDATIKDFYSSANLLPYLRMGELISKKAKLSKITDAFQDAKSGNVVKIVVSPD